MKSCTRCKQVKPLVEFNKRGGKSKYCNNTRSDCKLCQNERSKKYHSSKAEIRHKYFKDRRCERREKDLLYYKKNSDKICCDKAKQRSVKLNATPKWLTKSDWIEIKWAYKMAKDRTEETGIKHEVDHIIPLQGKSICGFHCPQNLQIITESENCSKGNRY